MFKLIFSKTYDFEVMQRYNLEHVIEDYFFTYENSFCVADGVTRDFTNGKTLTYPENYEQAIEIIENYPNPSGATLAAKICAETFIDYIKNINDITEKDIKNAVKEANHKIAEINKGRHINYTTEDYYCCVAVGGTIKDSNLICFSIGDCKIKVLNSNLDVIFDTSTQKLLPVITRKPFSIFKLSHKQFDWKNPLHRKKCRKNGRNNILNKILGKDTVGVLTGQSRANLFIDTYTVPLENAKYILVFSDGCEECLKTKEQITEVLANPEIIKNEKHEKTLLIYEKK